jgi:hypothetical protein
MLVSFSREVMPILALVCGGCHGLPSESPAGGLSLRSYALLMEGGNLGRVIRPGDPEGSPLMAFIDGRRGAAQRMPMNAPPLRPDQINLIRRWIADGAREDADTAPKVIVRREVNVTPGRKLQIEGRAPAGCFITVEALGASGKQLWIAESPKAPFQWRVVGERDWPPRVAVSMTVRYCGVDESQVALVISSAPRL